MSHDFNKALGKLLFTNTSFEDIKFVPADEDEMEQFSDADIPSPLPILALRNTVLFPSVMIPIAVGRKKSIRLIREAHTNSRLIGTVAQIDPHIEEPGSKDLYKVGTLARVIKIFEMPDGGITVLLQGLQRFVVKEIVQDKPYISALVSMLEDQIPAAPDEDYDAIVSSIRDQFSSVIKTHGQVPQEAIFVVKNLENRSFLINFVASNVDFSKPGDKQELLEFDSIKERGLKLVEYLNRELQLLEVKNDIQQKVRAELDQQQREYFLHQQIKTIQNELGDNPVEGEVNRLKVKVEKKVWSEHVQKVFEKELAKFAKMNPNGAEYSVQLNYLDTLADLPWGERTKDNLDLLNAKKILDQDHYGLDEVKDRILEYLAVIKMRGSLKSPIICLHGSPGVGKTSLGKSVARALGREFGRISLGGLHDEAEIRGHRRTYIGAMPGRIIQTINRCKTSNPVIILDEIDKVGSDFKGDPSSALLEVLDPEQNATFRDNYLDVDYDLSHVLFITTANRIDTIQPALRDRMEMIHISGYMVEEKIEIAKRHLVPKSLENHGLSEKKLQFDDQALEFIIEGYTRESGVRGLDKQIAKVIRNRTKVLAMGEKVKKKVDVKLVREILGAPKVVKDLLTDLDFVGVTTGLAWTEVGGEILFVEASLSPGKGAFSITGNLGDVMKESATIALKYIKAHAADLGLTAEAFDTKDVHIHVPEGAIPKDGPSAGVTMVTSMASAFTNRKVRKGLAMTGEITLRGKVLPVGGIKEKILAAKRAGAKDILLSKENRKDIDEIKPAYLEGLNFHYVDTIQDVWNLALNE